MNKEIANKFGVKEWMVGEGAWYEPGTNQVKKWFWVLAPTIDTEYLFHQICFYYDNGAIHPLRPIDAALLEISYPEIQGVAEHEST